jgi:hypothetical protein
MECVSPQLLHKLRGSGKWALYIGRQGLTLLRIASHERLERTTMTRHATQLRTRYRHDDLRACDSQKKLPNILVIDY